MVEDFDEDIILAVGAGGMALSDAAKGSEHRTCADCGINTAFAPGSLKRIADEGHIPICTVCLMERLPHDPNPVFILPQSTEDELRQHYEGRHGT